MPLSALWPPTLDVPSRPAPGFPCTEVCRSQVKNTWGLTLSGLLAHVARSWSACSWWYGGRGRGCALSLPLRSSLNSRLMPVMRPSPVWEPVRIPPGKACLVPERASAAAPP